MDAHHALGLTVVGGHFVVADGPVLVIAGAEAKAVSGPAERSAAEGPQITVVRTVAHASEVVALEVVGKNAGDGARVAFVQAGFKVRICVDVRAVVDARLHAPPGFQQRHFQARRGETPRRHTSAGTAAYYDYVERLASHVELLFHTRQREGAHCRMRTKERSICEIFATPAIPMSTPSSARSSSMTRATPRCPNAPRPHR